MEKRCQLLVFSSDDLISGWQVQQGQNTDNGKATACYKQTAKQTFQTITQPHQQINAVKINEEGSLIGKRQVDKTLRRAGSERIKENQKKTTTVEIRA